MTLLQFNEDGRDTLTGHGRCSGSGHDVLVDVFHVLHQSLVAEEEFVAQRTAGRVRSANQGRVLQNKIEYRRRFLIFN